MRPATRLAFLAALLLTTAAPAAETPPAAAGRVSFLHDGEPAPAALASLLEELASACERGDRVALVGLAPPDARQAAQSLADDIVSTPSAPLRDVRIEVATLARDGNGFAGSLLLLAREPPAPAPDEPLPPPPLGFARAEPGTAGAGLRFTAMPTGDPRGFSLALEQGLPARVEHARLEITLDPRPPRARSRGTLTLDARPRIALLDAGPSSAVLATAEGLRLTPLASELGGGGMSLVHVAWDDGAERGRVDFEADVLLPDGASRDGILALLHQAQAVPFASGRHFRYELTLDVPLPHRSVSVGMPEDLPAAEGRRRTRWTCDRAVDYLPIAAGPYDVSSLGEGAERLELWRTRDVGGDAAGILRELRDLVDFQTARIAPLPYRAMRLVELPVTEGLAVSYASMIFMTPGLLATRDQRAEILSHEVGHQWWGNAVSPHPTARWASEGMADAMRDLYLLEREGSRRLLDRKDEHRRRTLDALGPASRPLRSAPGGADAYDRGAMFVHALKAELGDDLFWRVLRRWYARLAGAEPTTADFQREAEAEAGRPLEPVFGPWLGSTALPVVRLEWSAAEASGPARIAVSLAQDAPAFPLEVPLRATGAAGERADWTMRLDALAASAEHELPFTPSRVTLDPDNLLPRVRPDEEQRYLRAEASACLGRGDAARARALLERLEASTLLDARGAVDLFAARMLDGAPTRPARTALDVALAELPTAAARQVMLLAAGDALLGQGAVAAALPLFDILVVEVDDGAAVPRRRGLALRALGREAEAQAALGLALERRPSDPATRALLGLAPQGSSAPGAGLEIRPVFADDDASLKATSSEGLHALAMPGERICVLLSGARRLLCGRAGSLEPVAGFAPSGALGAVVVGAATQRPRVVVLETQRLRSTLTIVDIDADGRGRVVAKHARAPGAARGLVAAGDDVLVAWRAAPDGLEWRRFTAPLLAPTPGPDDDDGLRRVTIADDARFFPAGTTPEPAANAQGPGAAMLPTVGLVVIQDDGRRVAGEGGMAWEELAAGSKVLAVHALPDGAALLVEGDASRSPFVEDARPSRRLVLLRGDDVQEVAVPSDALDVDVAADGSLVLERAALPRLAAGRLTLDAGGAAR